MTKKNHDADVTFIAALAELLRENDLSELEVRRDYGADDSLKVRVSRKSEVVTMVNAAPAPVAAASSAAPTTAAPAATAADPANDPGAITSPMVGTVYMSPEPGAAAFINVGDTVSEGQTLLIIEAMKTMNQIPSPRAGKVKRILVDDGSPVEFGEPLVILE